MSGFQLPTELCHFIVEKLSEDRCDSDARRDLLNLCLTSRDIYQVSTPFLYRNITLSRDLQDTLCCFWTLLQNNLAASSVRALWVHNLFNEDHASHGRSLNPFMLIPLFSDTLRRLTNLTSLYFYPVPTSQTWKAKLMQLFRSDYPFSLRVIRVDLPIEYPAIIGFVNRQSGLRDLGFMKLTTLEASMLRLPMLERVELYPDQANIEAATTFFRNHPRIKDATLRAYPTVSSYVLQATTTCILEEAKNLLSLHLLLLSPEDLATSLNLSGGSVWSSSLHLLQITVLGYQVDFISILPCMGPVLRGRFPNLKATWFNRVPSPTVDSFMVSNIEGPTWDFYFEYNEKVHLARCERGKERWAIERLEIKPKDIPSVRDRLKQM